MRYICISIATSKLGLRVGEELLNRLLSERTLVKYLIGVIHEDNIESMPRCIVHLTVVATGGTEHVIKEIANSAKLLYLLYTEAYNSLPAVVEAKAYLDKHGFKVRTSRLSSVEHLLKIIDKLVRVTSTYERVRTGRFGIIGGVSPWLIYSRLEPGFTAGRELGEIVEIPINELYKLYNEMEVSVEEVESIMKKSSSINLENTLLEISKALKVYKALEQLIEKHRLSAATLKCFDLIKDLKTTGCLAVSLLNSKLIPIACEGDVPLLYSMAIGTWISSNPVFMANIADIKDDTVTLAHCTSWLAGILL